MATTAARTEPPPPDPAADLVPHTFTGRGVTIEVERYGLSIKPSSGLERHIWWEEVRRVDWPAFGQARLWLIDETVTLDSSIGDLHALVEVIVNAAGQVHRQWRGRPLGGRKLAAWFEVRGNRPVVLSVSRPRGADVQATTVLRRAGLVVARPEALLAWLWVLALRCALGLRRVVSGEPHELRALSVEHDYMVCPTPESAREWVLAWVAWLLPLAGAALVGWAVFAAVSPQCRMIFIPEVIWWPRVKVVRRLGWLCGLASVGLARWLARRTLLRQRLAPPADSGQGPARPWYVRLVTVSEQGLWLDGEEIAWEQVRAVRARHDTVGGRLRVTLDLGSRTAVFELACNVWSRVAWAFGLLAHLTSEELVIDGDEPPPDGAISLARVPAGVLPDQRALSRDH